jgi:DNA invertase Pin-like site-specific DNA recombinase
MNTAVVFCRVSTRDQARERWSLPIQLEYNLKYAKMKGLELVHDPWSIVESGYKERQRREFRAMVEFIKENRVGHLVVLNEERLNRDLRGMVELDDLSREFLTIHFTSPAASLLVRRPPRTSVSSVQ